ncbi:MAG: HD domain-containing phosphohydrolase [Planctomycetota bacterium]
MSTAAPAPEADTPVADEPAEATSSAATDPTELVEVRVDALIVGRTLTHDIVDGDGVLLLAAGQAVTSEFKAKLKERQLGTITVSAADAGRVSLSKDLAEKFRTKVELDGETTQKLDTIIDCGLLTFDNNGPAMKDSMTFVGRKAYDQKQRARLVEKHEENGQLLSSVMQDALAGNNVDGNVVTRMATGYLKEMSDDTDSVLTSTMENIKGADIFKRSLESSTLAMALAVEMGLDEENVRVLGISGLVHDWGMVLVPEEVRNAPRQLTAAEMLEIKKHPIYSLEILQKVSALPKIVSVVAYQVHERFNGRGYPRGRRGNSIPLFARILQVADAFVGMTSDRPHRPPFMRYAAMEGLLHMARERSVDPDIVRALLQVQTLFPLGSFVTLSDDTTARVLRRNGDDYAHPIVQRLTDAEGNLVDAEADENIVATEDDGVAIVQALPTPGSDEIAFSDDRR